MIHKGGTGIVFDESLVISLRKSFLFVLGKTLFTSSAGGGK
jgi:hypothetical protein